MASDERTCPECAETIKAAAKVCRYCGFRLKPQADDRHPAPDPPPTSQPSPVPSPSSVPSEGLEFRCPRCASLTPGAIRACVHCGEEFDRGSATSTTTNDTSTFDPGVVFIVAAIAALVTLGVSFWIMESNKVKPASEATVSAVQPPASVAAPSVSYTTSQLSMVCRAGIAAEFARSPNIMSAREIEPGMMRVEYRRPDDPKLWKSDCKIEGNRIVWRTVDASPGSGAGRWRTTENDDVLTFKLDGNAVTTESSDGSSASETYRL